MMPDRWLEHVAELPGRHHRGGGQGVRDSARCCSAPPDDPADFYTEYAERRIRDETRTLADVGMPPRGVLSIRAYDPGHYPPFRG